MNSSEEEKSDEYLVVDSSNPWVLGWVYLRLEVEQEKECVWDITPAGQFGYHNSFWRPPNHAPLFFSMLFLLTPGSKAITACERVRKSRACAFLHHLFLPCHTAFISRPGNAAKDHHSRCIPDELPDDGFASQIFGKNKMMALR
jgi:hypothetical protein